MIGSVMKTQFEELIDDSHDETHTYQLMNQARVIVEHLRPWEYLKGVDESQTRSSGDTYLSMKTLVSGIRAIRKIISGTTHHTGVKFEDRIRYKDVPRKFYIDWANGQFALTGVGGASETIVQVYTKRGTVIDADGEWEFPSEYHDVIPYLMAEIYQGNIDPDDISVRQAVRQNKQAGVIINAMEMWDDELKMTAQDDHLDYVEEEEPIVDIGLL